MKLVKNYVYTERAHFMCPNMYFGIMEDYEEISSHGWDVRKESLLKILIYPKENDFQILFIAHHLLCDGRGLYS